MFHQSEMPPSVPLTHAAELYNLRLAATLPQYCGVTIPLLPEGVTMCHRFRVGMGRFHYQIVTGFLVLTVPKLGIRQPVKPPPITNATAQFWWYPLLGSSRHEEFLKNQLFCLPDEWVPQTNCKCHTELLRVFCSPLTPLKLKTSNLNKFLSTTTIVLALISLRHTKNRLFWQQNDRFCILCLPGSFYMELFPTCSYSYLQEKVKHQQESVPMCFILLHAGTWNQFVINPVGLIIFIWIKQVSNWNNPNELWYSLQIIIQ